MEIKCYFDGSCIGNPDGIMGFGAYITGLNKDLYLWDGEHPKENNTNNVAEFKALYLALENIINTSDCVITIYGDSQFVINTLNGKFKIGKAKRYTNIALKVQSLLESLKMANRVNLVWIPREQNEIADELSNRFYNENYKSIC